MTKPMIDDPNALAALVTGLGGTPIPGRTFTFDLPLTSVRGAVQRLNQLGLGVRKLSERIEDNPTKLFIPMTVTTLELYRPPTEKLDRLPEW
jgi:hypothetical protein